GAAVLAKHLGVELVSAAADHGISPPSISHATAAPKANATPADTSRTLKSLLFTVAPRICPTLHPVDYPRRGRFFNSAGIPVVRPGAGRVYRSEGRTGSRQRTGGQL